MYRIVLSRRTANFTRRYSSGIRGGPAELYQKRVKAGKLNYDTSQLTIINQLQALYQTLADYQPAKPPSSSSWFSNLFSKSDPDLNIPANLPNGIYLYGSVGTGKSMLMDSFYETLDNLPNSLPSKRIHFHQFMIDIHKRNHELQAQLHTKGELGKADVLVTIAKQIADECKVLCFDEFQVTDIVDAMILKRLLEGLLHYGVVIIMTSNRHPDELYKNGIQRESFLGCIELLKTRTKVIDLNSGLDYRKQIQNNSVSTRVFLSPSSDPNNQVEFKSTFENQLCYHALSAADYLKIVNQFNVIFVNDIPKLSISERDLARRFILFIDAAYESKIKLFTLSEVPITEIFSGEENPLKEMTEDMRSTMDDLGMDKKKIGSSSLFTGEEETFAWNRAVSRLNEMSSEQWSNSSDSSSS
ncbi:hypothetical protein Pst134EA_009537 [Puccinia striiformis f. sp. tritici]|uniref:hypothetical protein n=1 Tax=Puccinia striiformis f. sp. tritici TaxID=168172 RepID=UPI002007E74A|nr:hypothetical protein Pst134EA_009537 [Puccinia striiformis f. sp. tritici]KAH9469016.1 hypothetical protein Pst134EA_009537 [Puccinia striiformis f. sp. tritici]